MYPRGSPKFNLMRKATLGTKRTSPSITKRSSPKACAGEKPRAQWNPGLEKAQVEILHEHNTPYYRGQNGWSSETWNKMVAIFHAKHKHVNFTMAQIQDKEKELKREYKMLKEARKQSGAGWCEKRCMIEADADLWVNLKIKFKNKSFPLFQMLGELYDGNTAEGTYNFTSTSEPSQIAEEFEDERELEKVKNDDDLHMQNQVELDDDLHIFNQVEVDVDVGGRVDAATGGRVDTATGSRRKKHQVAKKPNKSADGMVVAVEKYIEMKTKQVEEERAESRKSFLCWDTEMLMHRGKDGGRERLLTVRSSSPLKRSQVLLSRCSFWPFSSQTHKLLKLCVIPVQNSEPANLHTIQPAYSFGHENIFLILSVIPVQN